MRVLHINNFFNYGGSALACLEAARILKIKHNIEQAFVGCVFGDLLSDFRKIGDTKYISDITGFSYPSNTIIKIIRDYNPNIVHIWMPGRENPNYFLDIADLPCKKIITVLCGQQIGFNQNIFDKVVFISKYNKQLSSFVNNACIIRPGLHIITTFADRLSRDLTMGRITAFCPSKHIEDTLICAAHLPDISFLIAGEILDHNYFNKLLYFIKLNNLSNVTIEPNVTYQRKQILYKTIDVLHYPTSNEAYCFSIVEGMAHGKPVISYKNSAITELNHENNLALAESNNIKELLNLTKGYISPSNRKTDGQKNRQVYKKYYTPNRYANEIMDLYNGICFNK